MKYDFETVVLRDPCASLKACEMEETIRNKGYMSFCGAEMDFKTAPAIEKAVKTLAEKGLYGFTLCDDRYRKTVCSWMEQERGYCMEPEWIIPTLGTIHSVATLIRMCTTTNESILISTPAYSRYEQAVIRLGRNCIKSPMYIKNGRYHLDFDHLEGCMKRPDVKIYILCNPHNPTGQIFKEAELEKLAELAQKYQVIVFSDEIFAETSYFGNQTPVYSMIKGAAENCIVSTSLGKTFNFTGVNHANMIIPNKEIREAFIKQRDADHYGSIEPFAYAALMGAYSDEGADWVHAMNDYVEENISRIKEFFASEFPEVNVYGGEGAYILWLDWRALFKEEEILMDFLLHKVYFELDPGSHYGEESVGFTRMCVASPWREIEKVLDNLKKVRSTINS